MSFHFNMQKVLDYREQLEEEAKVRLGKAESDFRAALERYDSIQKELADARSQGTGKLMQNGERWLLDQFIKGLDSDLKEAALQVRMLKQMTEEARKVLAARAMDRKMLEKLKERQKADHYKIEQKQEQNFNDEIATIRYKAPAF